MIRAIDLFAGAGGFSEGARQSGLQVVWAANHDPLAVSTHARNHPATAHSCQDLQLADWTSLPKHDLMMASPCCQGFSKAKGETKGWSEKSRSTAWCVYSCAAANRPEAIVVENVPEIRSWTESDDPASEGSVFRAWRDLIARIGPGYHYADVVVDAADLGVPQHRERLFMAFVRKDLAAGPVAFAAPSGRHTPAATILEAGAGLRWSRVRDKAATTRAFVKRTGERRFAPGTPFLVPYFSKTLKTGLGRDLDRPIGTITTKARYAVVSDCHAWLRMLTIREYQRAMAFPDLYILPGSQAAAIRQLGNAVCPPVASWVLTQVRQHMGCRHERRAA